MNWTPALHKPPFCGVRCLLTPGDRDTPAMLWPQESLLRLAERPAAVCCRSERVPEGRKPRCSQGTCCGCTSATLTVSHGRSPT